MGVEYFHIELEAHALLLAEGLAAESYLDTGNRGFFANAAEPLVLHPDLTDESDNPTREAASCFPFVWDEAHVLPVWQRLADRASALGQPAATLDTTTDPELHLVVGRQRIRPIHAKSGLFIFPIPRGATAARLVSRAASPTDARPWLEDRRRLGVPVTRIVLRDATEAQVIPVDHPGLRTGWWAVEQEGAALRRWTNGEANLPLPSRTGTALLEVHLGGTMTYVRQSEAGSHTA